MLPSATRSHFLSSGFPLQHQVPWSTPKAASPSSLHWLLHRMGTVSHFLTPQTLLGDLRDQHPSLPVPSAFLFLPQSQPSGCSTGLRIRQNPKVGIQALPFTSYVATGQSLILPKPQFLNQKTGIKTPYSQAVGSIVKSLACVRETGQPGDHPCPYLRILPPSLA